MITTEVKHTYKVYDEQYTFINMDVPYFAMVGGRGSGKTRAGAYKALRYFRDHPGAFGIITAPTYKMLKDATMRTCLENWPRELIEEIALTDMKVKIAGSEVLFRSTEDPDKLRGPSIAFFWMDEGAESPGVAFEILQGCLRQPGMSYQGWVTSTPKGYNWLYEKFIKMSNPDYKLIQCSSRLNPYLPASFVKALEESYRDDWALQEIEGQFVVVSAQAVFPIDILKEMLGDCREPIEITEGAKLWRKPVVGRQYVIGADVGMLSDYCAAVVLDSRVGEVVATLHGRFLLDEFALKLSNLGRLFNNALLAVEAEPMEGIVINKLKELQYPRLYKTKERYGWLTTHNSKPIMILELEEAIRKRAIMIYDRNLLGELFLYSRNPRGQFMAGEGGHDDQVMALAIAWQVKGSGGPIYAPKSYLRFK